MSQILEYQYSTFYWMKIDLSDNEFQSFVNNFQKMNLLDGVDEPEKEVCLRFNHAKPKTVRDIPKAKQINVRNCKRFLTDLSKKIDGRLYFNINRKILKRK